MNADYDLIVIGGGAGGMSAARTAARRGARTLLVQAGPIGGECTFTGCVPSKALIAAAAEGKTFDQAMGLVRRSIDTIAATTTDDIFAKEGIAVLHGWATFRSPAELDVNGHHLSARRFVLATGSLPAVPPIAGLDQVDYLTNETVFDLHTQPKSLAVLGGGPMGCELAQAFSRLGSAVTIIEALDRVLPREDRDASAAIREVFAGEAIAVLARTEVVRAETLDSKGGVRLHLAAGSTLDADRLLVAAGRNARTDGTGLDAAGVATERGFVVTDDRLATSASGIWAAGDVTGRLAFTHAADEMGRVAANNACSPRWRRRRFDASAIPWVTYTDPEVGHVGLTEDEAASVGRARVAFLPMAEVDRAIVTEQTAGFVKLVAGPRPVLRNVGGGRLLGATIVASRAGELIHEPTLAMRTRMFTGRLAQTVHAYPSWSVSVRQAAAQFFLETEGRQARPARRRDKSD
jgi:pyruvate/2-oxoglutarate dehydrogenase complex dihydrolipoamide dehydrogenase (E3) component